jgi:hypothetical protein
LARRVAATSPDQSSRWAARATTYAHLQRDARDLAGRIGDGGLAVTEAANAISRLRRLGTEVPLRERELRALAMLSDRVDARIAAILEQAARERLYFARARVPRIVDDDGRLPHQVRERFVPITSPVQSELVQRVRQALRPAPAPGGAPPGARASRVELQEAIGHRPARIPSRMPARVEGPRL